MNKIVPLATICKYIRGITFKPEDKVEIGTVDSAICMRTKNIQKILDESDLIAISKKHVKRKEQFLETGDILISSANSWDLVGKCVQVPKLKYEATAGGFISILRPDSSQVDSNYLFYWLSSNSIQLKVRYCARQTTNIANLDANQFLDLEIPLPPLPEQKRIAAILDKADAVRRKRQETIRLLDEFLRSVFLEMFRDPVRNGKGWEVHTLDFCCNKITDGTHQSPKFVNSGIPFIFVSNIIQNEINYNTTKFISKDTYLELTKSTPIEIGDLLYTIVGSYGNPAIVKSDRKFCFQRHIAHLKPNPIKINSLFLLGLLKSDFIKMQVDGLVKGIAQKTLNLSELKSLKVFLPPMGLQNKYGIILEKTEQQKEQVIKSLSEMENGFNSMLQKAFRGEL